jgi:6-phosphogluconolactonase (cycloisomerase 2 family)
MSKHLFFSTLFLTGSFVVAACGGDDDQSAPGGGRGGSTAGSAAGGKAGASAGSSGGGKAGNNGGSPGVAGVAGVTAGAGGANAGRAGGGMSAGAAGSTSAGAGGVTGASGSSGQAGETHVGEGGEAGAPGTPVPTGKRHLYVGCADSSGSLQIYLQNGASLSAIDTVVAGGAISNSIFNAAQNHLYVAYALAGGDARIGSYSRNTTTGALAPFGTPAVVPFATPSTGGMGGMGGMGGAGGRGGTGGRGGGGASGRGGRGGGGAGGLGGASGTSGAAGMSGASGAAGASTGPGPQTLTFDAGEAYLAVPNYYAGNVYVYGVLGDGTLGGIVGADAGGTNAHNAVFSNNNQFMVVPYLGSNFIKVYAFNQNAGAIALASQTAMPVDMSGPRHIALHPNGLWLYSINETAGGADTAAGSLDLFDFDQTNGSLTPVHTYAVPLPDGYSGVKNGAEIVIAPSGSFLYVSMRLDSVATGSIVSYAIGVNGALSFIEQVSSGGITPRQFSLSRDGSLLIVGNQNSDNIVLFVIDPSSGKLTRVADRDVCHSPRFARFAEIQ